MFSTLIHHGAIAAMCRLLAREVGLGCLGVVIVGRLAAQEPFPDLPGNQSAPAAAPTEQPPASNDLPPGPPEANSGSPAETPAPVPPTEEQIQQSEEHFKQGREAITAKDWEKAISELESALKFTPENGAIHHALGVAYMGDQQANAGWFHFRQAVRYSPNYVPASIDFLKTWKLLDAQGVFNVGTPLAQIARTLGKPDQADDQGIRLRLVYGFMSLNFMNGQLFSILDLRQLPPEGLHAVDGLAFDLSREDWQVAYRMLSASQGNTEYVRRGEKLQNWTELFASQRFINTAEEQSALDVMQGMQTRLRETFPEVTFEVLKETPEDTLFVWSIASSENHPAQQEVVRLVRGKRDIHRLAYTRKGADLDASALEPWIKTLETAELLPAEKLREHLLQEEEKLQEDQLREISVQILSRQFELIRAGNVEDLKVFFTQEAREKITPELLQKVAPELENLDPADLVDQVDLKTGDAPLKAQLINSEGKVFTTLIQDQGRWFAENVWLETIIK